MSKKPDKSLDDAWLLNRKLNASLRNGTLGRGEAPELVRQVIEAESWKLFFIEPRNLVSGFESFADFVAAPPPEGLGLTVASLTTICRDDAEVVAAIEKLTPQVDHSSPAVG